MVKATIHWSAKQVHKMVTYGSLVFDNAIQRGYVWDKTRQSLFVDSLLRDYPVPAIYTVKSDRKITTPKGEANIYDALDGKQRCLTITKFRNNEFALSGIAKPVTYMDENGAFATLDINGMTYDDLPETLKDIFDSYGFTFYYFSDVTDEEVVEIMARLNNGKPLTAAENTRIKACDLSGIQKLAGHELFKNCFTEKAIDGYQNEDTIVKMYSVLHDNASLENKTIRKVYDTWQVSNEDQEELNAILDYAYEIYKIMMESKMKTAAKKIVKRMHLISITRILKQGLEENRDPKNMATMFGQLFNGKPTSNEKYNAACANGVNYANNVTTRLAELQHEYNWYFSLEDEYYDEDISVDSESDDTDE